MPLSSKRLLSIQTPSLGASIRLLCCTVLHTGWLSTVRWVWLQCWIVPWHALYLTGLYRLYMYIISFVQSYPQCIIVQTVNNASPLHIYMYAMKLLTNLLGCCLWWFLLLFCCFFAWFGDSLYRKQKKQQQFSNVRKKEWTKLKKY